MEIDLSKIKEIIIDNKKTQNIYFGNTLIWTKK